MWYLVMSRTVRKIDETNAIFREHREWLDESHRAGRILFSGPTADRTFGIYVVLASSLDEAKRIAGEDPYHRDGLRELQVLEWDVRRALRLEETIDDFTARAQGA